MYLTAICKKKKMLKAKYSQYSELEMLNSWTNSLNELFTLVNNSKPFKYLYLTFRNDPFDVFLDRPFSTGTVGDNMI
jgi:hypothetical protein